MLISDTTRCGPHCISTCDITLSLSIAVTSPTKRLRAERPTPEGSGVERSARNRLVGLVTAVVKDRVMAQVEMQCGPHRVVSLISTEAATELGLEPGVLAVAVVKSTNVVVERPTTPTRVVQT